MSALRQAVPVATSSAQSKPNATIIRVLLTCSYAPGIVPQKEAMAEGYSQNLWLLGDEHALTEVSYIGLTRDRLMPRSAR
jgi:branched-subunit amino acid aminotransferase/4-amino-4-deoxychorismate lyase